MNENFQNMQNISTKSRDPDKFFQSKTTVCAGYANLFTRMLKAMNYNEENIKNITGYAKGGGYDVNTEQEKLKADHEWNAVKINGKWCLIDATWDAGETNYTYFCTDPKCFVRDHLPEKTENQFLDKTIDLPTFHNLAWTSGLFCELNGEIIADKSISNSCSGKYTFKYDSNNNRLSFLEIDFREDETNTGKYKNNILESIIGAEFTDRYEIIDDNNSYKVIRTWKDGIIDSSYYKYDKLGRLLEVKEFDGRRTTYYYGEHGFADKVDMPGSEETNNYKFDDKGNWIERITYSKEKPFASKIAYIITRKYEYK